MFLAYSMNALSEELLAHRRSFSSFDTCSFFYVEIAEKVVGFLFFFFNCSNYLYSRCIFSVTVNSKVFIKTTYLAGLFTVSAGRFHSCI